MKILSITTTNTSIFDETHVNDGDTLYFVIGFKPIQNGSKVKVHFSSIEIGTERIERVREGMLRINVRNKPCLVVSSS